MRTRLLILSVAIGAGLTFAQPGGGPETPAAVLDAQIAAVSQARQAKDPAAAAQALQKATALLREMSPDDPARWSALRKIAQLHILNGHILQAESLWQEQVSATAKNPVLLARALDGLATHYQAQQQYRKAVATLHQLLTEKEKQYGSGHAELKPVLQNLAFWYERMGELRQAEAMLQRAEGLPEAPAPEVPPGVPRREGSYLVMQSTRGTLADFYVRHFRLVDAERLYRANIARTDLSVAARKNALNSLARLLEQQRRFADAIDVQQQVIREADAGGDSLLAAGSRQVIARMLLNSGDRDQADKLFQEEMQRTSALTGDRRREYGSALISYSLSLAGQKRYDEAEKLLKQYLAEAQNGAVAGFSTSAGYSLLANLEHQRGNREAAEAWRSQDSTARVREPIPPAELVAVNEVTKAVYQGKTDEAASQLEQVLASIAAQGPKAAAQLMNLPYTAAELRRRGQPAVGDSLLNRAVALMEQFQGLDSFSSIMMRLDYYQQVDPEQGLALVEQMRGRTLALTGPQHPSELMWINRKISLLQRLQRTSEQEEAFQEAIRLTDAIYGPRSSDSIVQRRTWASDLVSRPDPSLTAVERAWMNTLQTIEEGDGIYSMQYATATVSYAQALARLKQPDRSLALLEKTIASMKEMPGTEVQVRNLEDGLKMISRYQAKP